MFTTDQPCSLDPLLIRPDQEVLLASPTSNSMLLRYLHCRQYHGLIPWSPIAVFAEVGGLAAEEVVAYHLDFQADKD